MTRPRLLMLLAAAAAAMPVMAQDSGRPVPPRFDVKHLDTTVDPRADFARFAFGRWLQANPIPGDKSRWGGFDELAQYNWAALKQVLETTSARSHEPGSVEQKVGDFFVSAMNTDAIDGAGLRPIADDLARVDGIGSLEDLAQVLAYLHNQGVPSGFAVSVGADQKNSTINALYARQGGMSLPSKEYYFADQLRQADRFAPGNADAAFARRLQTGYFGHWAEMEVVYRELAAQFPDHPTGHYLLGSVLMDVGRWNEAVEALRKSKARQPLSPINRYKLTISLWSAGKISEAEREIDEAMRWSVHNSVWQTKIKLLAMTGRPKAALAVVDDPSNRPADTTEEQLRRWRIFLGAMASRTKTDIESATAFLTQFARKLPGPPISEAFQCAMLGRTELALSILEGCYLGTGEWASKRPADPTGNASHPLFQPQARSLWGEPVFARILQGIGLEQYWRTTKSLPDYRRN